MAPARRNQWVSTPSFFLFGLSPGGTAMRLALLLSLSASPGIAGPLYIRLGVPLYLTQAAYLQVRYQEHFAMVCTLAEVQVLRPEKF